MIKRCRCNCGYRCGGPGRCKLGGLECLQQPEGHYVRDCEHDWTGPWVEFDVPGGGREGGVTCARCGMFVGTHDMRVGP
jgi:hypothetical protein